jgi:hypothetical protein
VSAPQDQQQEAARKAARTRLQDQQESIKRTFSAAPAASPIVSCPKGALTEQQAQERFDKFKCREDIPWDYPQDCCYNRAHVMATELQAEGVDVGKVWNYAPTPWSFLRVATPYDRRGYVEWHYHVAPTIPVMDSKGNVSRMVIDPSITNGPVTADEWKALQGQPGSILKPTNEAPLPYYRHWTGAVLPTPTDEEVRKIFDKHRDRRDTQSQPKQE